MRLNINPVYKKELKLSVRTMRTPIIIVIFNTILTIIGLVGFYLMNEEVKISGNINYRSNVYLYILLVTIEFILIVFIMPSMTSSQISGERERQTLNLLLSTKLKPHQIITGKLLSALSLTMLVIVSGIPVISLAFIYGGVSFYDIIIAVLYLLFAALFIGSLGIFCSSVLKKTTFATVLTYGIELFIIAGSIFIVYGAYYIQLIKNNYNFENCHIGAITLLLIINPAVTFLCILFGQIGSYSSLYSFFERLGMPGFALNHFVAVSIVIQLCIMLIVFYLAIHYLQTERKSKTSKKKES